MNTLKKDWNPRQWSLYNLFEVTKCLFIIPFPESSLNEKAGKIFMENYEEYFKIAKIYTRVHAGGNNNKQGEEIKETFSKTNNDDVEMEMNDKNNEHININTNNQINSLNNSENEQNSLYHIGRSRTINPTTPSISFQSFDSGLINNNIHNGIDNSNNNSFFNCFSRANSTSNVNFGFGDLTNMVNNGCFQHQNRGELNKLQKNQS